MLLKQGELEYLSIILIFLLRWDSELARVAQVWADQCASVIYRHGGLGNKVTNGGDLYPLLFHEKGIERATEKFQSSPGVGQVFIIKAVGWKAC